jgi:hypothetical protein
MKLEDLTKPAKDLKAAYKKTIDRRHQWNETTKKIVHTSLGAVTSHLKMDMQVQNVPLYENYSAVTLLINNSASGIANLNGSKQTFFVKHGGSLAFSQSYSGKIFVIANLPYIESVTNKLETKVLATAEPDDINEEYVYEKVSRFLELLADWEQSKSDNTVGFKMAGVQ